MEAPEILDASKPALFLLCYGPSAGGREWLGRDVTQGLSSSDQWEASTRDA